jgi:hypothetical protein
MKITEVTVHAERNFVHPHEKLDLRPRLTITAQLSENEDLETVVKDLQARAEVLMEDHKQSMLDSLDILYIMEMQKNLIKDY